MMRRFLLPLLLAAICFAQPAWAQINPFRGSSGTPLTSEDITALTDATVRLLDRQSLVVGGTETWSNQQTGASGTVTAGKAVQRKGLACRIVDYRHIVPGPSPQRGGTLTWCKTKDGWKVA